MIKRLTVDQSAPAKQSRKRGQAESSSTGIFLASAIEQLPTNSIKNYDRNPRVHGDRQITKLASTIRKAGFSCRSLSTPQTKWLPVMAGLQLLLHLGSMRFRAFG